MPPPFTPLDLRGFTQLLDAWVKKPAHRKVTEVHMHHTWRPDHSQYRKQASIDGMWRYHTETNGWSDIAQHVTIAPDGAIWTGRHWDQPPASSAGRNGTRFSGPFMFEMIGDFDAGRDSFDGPQRDAVLRVIALVQDAFDLPVESLQFHRGLGSPKTCPGSGIRYEEVVAEVRAMRGGAARPRGAGRNADTAEVGVARARLLEEPPEVTEDADAEPMEEHGHSHDVPGEGVRAEEPLGPAALSRLRPHVVNLWGGRYSREGTFRTEKSDIAAIFDEYLPARIGALPNGQTLPILLYAHGGLVSEEDGLRMAAAQIPWWRTNGVYPLHFIWETGFGETISRMVGTQRGAARSIPPGAAQRGLLDPVIEGLVRGLGGQHVWGGMKFGAAAAFDTNGDGLDLLRRMAAFVKLHEGRVTLHAVGHSAGSIFHAYLLPRLLEALTRAGSATKVETLHLMAPAITVADYKARLDPLVGKDIGSVAMFTMSKDYELADTVTPLYRKSLLYLISRSLEPERDTPILGLEESVRADDALRRRFGLGGAAGQAAEVIWSRSTASTGRSASLSVTHGGFDNDPATMESILRRVRGLRDTDAPDLRFPPEAATGRSFADIAAQALPEDEAAASAVEAHVVLPAAPSPSATLDDRGKGGRRRALCVGIDAYPDPAARLAGCVADAREWEAGLGQLGYAVQRLHDAAATRTAIMDGLGRMLAEARAGDHLVFTFAGHGMQMDDIDTDEDDTKDEAICPFDYDDGRLVIDDDLAKIFGKLNEGVQLTCFFDCCHSGTNTRFAVGRAELPAGAKARFLLPTLELAERHRRYRQGLGAGAARTRGGARSTPADMRQVVFAACRPWEVALEMNGRGDFSVRAVPLLNQAGRVSNAQFQQLVTKRFGARPRQNPNLDCAEAMRDVPFLAGGRSAAGRGSELEQRLDASLIPEPRSVGSTQDTRVIAAADLLDAAARLLR